MTRNKKIARLGGRRDRRSPSCGFGAVLVYVNFDQGRTPRAKFDEASLDSVLRRDDHHGARRPGHHHGRVRGAATTAASATTTAATPAARRRPPAIAGTWTVAADSQVGYRVKETLAGVDTEGAGRTNAITGTMTIDGTTVTATDLTVDMTTFESDDSRRDGQFNGRIMEVSQFPTATFTLTTPIEHRHDPHRRLVGRRCRPPAT